MQVIQLLANWISVCIAVSWLWHNLNARWRKKDEAMTKVEDHAVAAGKIELETTQAAISQEATSKEATSKEAIIEDAISQAKPGQPASGPACM